MKQAESHQALRQALCGPAAISLPGPLPLRAFHHPIFPPRSRDKQLCSPNSAKGCRDLRAAQEEGWD